MLAVLTVLAVAGGAGWAVTTDHSNKRHKLEVEVCWSKRQIPDYNEPQVLEIGYAYLGKPHRIEPPYAVKPSDEPMTDAVAFRTLVTTEYDGQSLIKLIVNSERYKRAALCGRIIVDSVVVAEQPGLGLVVVAYGAHGPG